MAIISRRIQSPLGYLRAQTVRGGMGGAESCGPTQKWDPNYVFQGIKGQCIPSSQPLVKMASEPGFLTSLMSAFSKPSYATPTAQPSSVAPAASGMSQTTMLAIGAVGLVALVLIVTRK